MFTCHASDLAQCGTARHLSTTPVLPGSATQLAACAAARQHVIGCRFITAGRPPGCPLPSPPRQTQSAGTVVRTQEWVRTQEAQLAGQERGEDTSGFATQLRLQAHPQLLSFNLQTHKHAVAGSGERREQPAPGCTFQGALFRTHRAQHQHPDGGLEHPLPQREPGVQQALRQQGGEGSRVAPAYNVTAAAITWGRRSSSRCSSSRCPCTDC